MPICLLCAVLRRFTQSHIAMSIIAYSGAWRMGWLVATCAVPLQIRNDWDCKNAINNKTALLRIIGRTATLPYLTIGNVATITPKIQLNGDTKSMKAFEGRESIKGQHKANLPKFTVWADLKNKVNIV